MKQSAIILLIIAAVGLIYARPSREARAAGSPGMTVMVFPFRMRAEIVSPESYYREAWLKTQVRYAAVIRGASAKLAREISTWGYRQAVSGDTPVIPDGQQAASGGALWPYIHASIMAGADSFLLCDITRMEYSERVGHYGFEIYSVQTYRVTASFDVRLIDARAEKIIRTATVNDSATHRVHRLFWDSIWIHRYTTGPDLAEKLMESAAGKIAREIRG